MALQKLISDIHLNNPNNMNICYKDKSKYSLIYDKEWKYIQNDKLIFDLSSTGIFMLENMNIELHKQNEITNFFNKYFEKIIGKLEHDDKIKKKYLDMIKIELLNKANIVEKNYKLNTNNKIKCGNN